jgi:hypothetical protein
MQKITPKYHIKIVQDIAEFEKLESEWNMIAENSGHHVPFLCFDWFKIWLKYFVKGNDLFILLVYDGDHPVAIAPLLFKSEKFRGFIKARKIELIGNVHSPIRNFIFKNQDDEEKGRSLRDIIDFFKGEYRDWDVIELDSLPEEDRSIDILTKIVSRSGLKQRQYNCFGDWYLDEINYSGDEYIKGRISSTII